MPIDRDINLDDPNGLTQEDIDQMEAEADRLKEIAESAEDSAGRIKKSSKVFEGKSFAELNSLQNTPEMANPNDIEGLSREELNEAIIQILAELEKAKQERTENTEAIAEVQTMAQQIREGTGQIRGGFGELMSFKSSPKNFGLGKMKMLIGKAGIYGMLANFAIDMGQQVFNQVLSEVKAQFGAGGVWDRRKLVEDEVNEYNSIAYLTRIRSGQVFMNADAGQELRQGAVKGANNTRALRDGHMRFIQFHGGL